MIFAVLDVSLIMGLNIGETDKVFYINTFKKRLKTVLFDRAYTDVLLLLYGATGHGSYSGALQIAHYIVMYCIVLYKKGFKSWFNLWVYFLTVCVAYCTVFWAKHTVIGAYACHQFAVMRMY